jgi:hypothetical protein
MNPGSMNNFPRHHVQDADINLRPLGSEGILDECQKKRPPSLSPFASLTNFCLAPDIRIWMEGHPFGFLGNSLSASLLFFYGCLNDLEHGVGNFKLHHNAESATYSYSLPGSE